MHDGDIVILRGSEVREVLAGRELELIQAVRSQFTSVVGDEYAQQLVGAIRGGVKIQRNQTALAKLKGELAGNRPTS